MQPDTAPQQLFTRRRVLTCAMTATIGATCPALGTVAFANAPNAPRVRTGGFERARFAAHVGTTVELRLAGAPAVRAQLVAVEDLAGDSVRHLAGSPDAYALRFRGPSSGPQPRQDTVDVRHPGFGAVRLFVTSSPSTPRQREYIAVINRALR